MGTCQRPGKKDKVKEQEQAGTDLHLPEDVLSPTLQVRDDPTPYTNYYYYKYKKCKHDLLKWLQF